MADAFSGNSNEDQVRLNARVLTRCANNTSPAYLDPEGQGCPRYGRKPLVRLFFVGILYPLVYDTQFEMELRNLYQYLFHFLGSRAR